jgi:thiamine pyrophosphokinase
VETFDPHYLIRIIPAEGKPFAQHLPSAGGCFVLKRAIIFSNGILPDAEAARDLVRPGDWLIAADGGLPLALSLGFTPQLIIGDMDSSIREDVSRAQDLGAELELFPRNKDATDLELALRHAQESGCDFIRVVGGMGGRSDQALANLFLLADPALRTVDLRLDDGVEEALVIYDRAEISGSPGDIVSLLPLGGPAEGIVTEGLLYPLRGGTLLLHRTRGISNEMTGALATVSLEKGLLICIHSRQVALSQQGAERSE